MAFMSLSLNKHFVFSEEGWDGGGGFGLLVNLVPVLEQNTVRKDTVCFL